MGLRPRLLHRPGTSSRGVAGPGVSAARRRRDLVGDGRQIAPVRRSMAAALAACVFIACASAAPAPSLSRFEFSEPHMGTTFTVVLYAPDAARAARASGVAFTRI